MEIIRRTLIKFSDFYIPIMRRRAICVDHVPICNKKIIHFITAISCYIKPIMQAKIDYLARWSFSHEKVQLITLQRT